MERYRYQKKRTAVITLSKESGLYRRQDIISAVESCVGSGKILGLGQLENNHQWEVVYRCQLQRGFFWDGML